MTDADVARSIDVLVGAENWRRVGELAALLDQDALIRMVGSASLANLPQVAARSDPDVVLVDVSRAGITRVALAAWSDRATVVVLPVDATETDLIETARCRVSVILAGDEEIGSAVRVARAGGTWVSPAIGAALLRLIPGQDLEKTTWEQLTPREVEVLRFVADGVPNASIAARLCITERTVKYHMANMRRKLHARDRAHLVALSFRTGVLTRQLFPGAM